MSISKDLASLYAEIDGMLTDLVCKEEIRANKAATVNTEFYYGQYANAVKMKDKLTSYDITLTEFHREIPRISIGLAEKLISGVELYSKHLTETEINRLLSVLRAARIEEYEETNNYYRMLLGLPNLEDTEDDWVYYKGTPIHLLSASELYECTTSGFLSVAINEHDDKPYLWYIGKGINVMFAREAGEFDILWSTTDFEHNKLRECYNKERAVFMKTIHSDYLCETTDYAEARELTTLKLQGILLYKLTTNANELDRTEFSVEDATTIWGEFGLAFPSNMIESYRNTTTFLLHYLTTLKGTNAAVSYISKNIFSGISLYKYFIRKTHNSNLAFPLPEGTKPEDFYNVEFVLKPFYATNIVDFQEENSDDRVLTYDEVVSMDPKWRDTDELKNAIFSSDFSYSESKYLSLNNFVDLSEFSNTLSVLIRILIEHRNVLETQIITVPSINMNRNAYHVIVYYLALVTRYVEGKNVIVPDSLEDASKLYGFKIPDNLDELRIKFAWFFTQSDYSYLLDEFPDAIDTNGSFFNFVVNTDKIVGLESYMYDLLNSCDDWEEYNLASDIFDLVKIVSRTPASYDTEGVTGGFTYSDWLLKNDEELYNEYNIITASDDLFAVEIDTMTQTLVKFFSSAVSEGTSTENISDTLELFNIIMNGVSKYLIYILNLFKSYSSEFLNESVAYYFGEKYNVLRQIPNIRIDGSYDIYTIDNYTDWDGVIVKTDIPVIKDTFVQDSNVLFTSKFGDIKINNQGG